MLDVPTVMLEGADEFVCTVTATLAQLVVIGHGPPETTLRT